MTSLLDDRAKRRAKVRAVATAIVDDPQAPRTFLKGGAELAGGSRRRRGGNPPGIVADPLMRRLGRRRLLAAIVLLLQLAALATALWVPAFRVKIVSVTGLHLLDRAAVLRTANVPSGSIFTADGEAVAARVRTLPWVRSVTVSTELPASVRIIITEWQPMVRVRSDGHDIYYAENGTSLDGRTASAGAPQGIPLLIDERSAASRVAVSPKLIQILGSAGVNFPTIFGVTVVAYEWDPDGRFSVWTSSGWRAILGHVQTDAAVCSVPDQLSALSALRGTLDFAHPKFGYVDLEDAAAPAVGGAPGLPPRVQSALAPAASGAPAPIPPLAPSPTPSPAVSPPTSTPTPAPPPTPAPTPTPKPTFHLPPAPTP